MASLTLSQMLSELKNSCKLKSTTQYVNYIGQLDKANKNQTANWINSSIQGNSLSDPVGYAMSLFDNWAKSYIGKQSQKTISNWKSAYKQLATSVLGIFYANVWAFSNNSSKIDEVLCKIVAQNALFPSRDVIKMVINGQLGAKPNIGKGNPYASWDCMSTIRNTKNKGKIVSVTIGGVIYTCRADDNTYANKYIKQAVSISKGIKGSISNVFVDYEACHIWGNPGDPRYYASVANIVLLPRAFGQLTDHCPAVKDLLRYEAYKRFGFLPTGVSTPPKMPTYYNKIVWRI